jgi:uracil-DNA glycosylase family 4
MITAAVRCAPPANRPLPDELKSCRAFLREELQMLSSLRVVITLGHVALRAFLQAWRDLTGAAPDPAVGFRHNQEYALKAGITLIISYHPSRQNTQTGRLTRSMFYAVFEKARGIIGDAPSHH